MQREARGGATRRKRFWMLCAVAVLLLAGLALRGLGRAFGAETLRSAGREGRTERVALSAAGGGRRHYSSGMSRNANQASRPVSFASGCHRTSDPDSAAGYGGVARMAPTTSVGAPTAPIPSAS